MKNGHIMAGLVSVVALLLLAWSVVAESLTLEQQSVSASIIAASGTTWRQVNESGFGEPSNTQVSALEAFDGQLYAGAQNWADGGQIWRTADIVTWTQVISLGFGSAYTNTNAVIFDMIEFDGQLYAGAGSWGDDGVPGQIWRSSNGTTWAPVESNGFGNANTDELQSQEAPMNCKVKRQFSFSCSPATMKTREDAG